MFLDIHCAVYVCVQEFCVQEFPCLLIVGCVSTSNAQVIVDMREFRSSLPSLLHARGMEVIPVTLEVWLGNVYLLIMWRKGVEIHGPPMNPYILPLFIRWVTTSSLLSFASKGRAYRILRARYPLVACMCQDIYACCLRERPIYQLIDDRGSCQVQPVRIYAKALQVPHSSHRV